MDPQTLAQPWTLRRWRPGGDHRPGGLEAITGLADWRAQHPRASFREIETALDERLDLMRAHLLSEAALASDRVDGSALPEEERPICPECKVPLKRGSVHQRRLWTQGWQEVVLERSQGTCPQ